MRYGRAIAALALCAGAVIFGIAINEGLVSLPGQTTTEIAIAPPPVPLVPGVKPSQSEEGDPADRRSYELMMLVDPATGKLPTDIFLREQKFAKHLPVRAQPVLFDSLDKGGNLSGWLYRGPHNLGGRTRAFAMDVSDPSNHTLLAGGVSGGMWRTTNEGLSWTMTTGSSQLHSVSTLAQDTRPGHQNVWYYGTGEYYGDSTYGGGNAFTNGDGIFKSVDSGVTWTSLPATAAGDPQVFSNIWQYVNRVAIDPSNLVEDEVYAATFGQIHRSVDGGATWTAVLGTYSPWSYFTDLVVSPTGVVYASLNSTGGQTGIFRSTDGINWANITPPGLTDFGRIVMALAPSDENIMYASVSDIHGTANVGFYRYDYVSGDGSGAGGIWDDRSANMFSLPGSPYGNYDVSTQGGYCQFVTVKPDDPNTVFLGGVELTRSTDGFASSSNVTWVGGWTYTNHHADQHWMFFLPGSSSIAYTGSDGGVHKTSNANASSVSWISLNNGYNTSQFYTVAIDEFTSGSNVVMGGTQDNGTQWCNAVNPTGNWLEPWGGDGSYCAVVNTSSSVADYFYSYQNGVVYYQGLDSAGSYSWYARLDPTGAGDYLFINPFILDPNDQNIMYLATSNGVWRNADLYSLRTNNVYSNSTQTMNWSQLTSIPANDPVTALAVTRNGARTLYYGTASGSMYRVDNAHTAPAGITPTAVVSPAIGYVSCIAIDPLDDQHLLISYSNYNVQSIWESLDGGASWTDIESNLAGADGPSVRSLRIVHRAGYEIWLAGTSVGLYSKTNDDPDWAREADSLIGTVVVDYMTSRDTDGLVVVGTHGRGVYSIQIPGDVVASEIVTLDGAERTTDGVTVSWHVSPGLYDNQIFVYREREPGDWTQLNAQPLPGNRTSYLDRTAPGGEATYQLKLVSPSGAENWHGPITVAGAAPGTQFYLAPASPNPFRDTSTMSFNLPRSGYVSVSIYDIRGRLVRTISNDVLSEGIHQAVWDGRTNNNVRAAAGVYYAKVQTDADIRAQKIILVR